MINVRKVREKVSKQMFCTVATINWLCFGCFVSNEIIRITSILVKKTTELKWADTEWEIYFL